MRPSDHIDTGGFAWLLLQLMTAAVGLPQLRVSPIFGRSLRENLSGRIVQVGLSPPVTFMSLHCTRHGLAPGHSGLIRPESMHTVSSLRNIDPAGHDPPPAEGFYTVSLDIHVLCPTALLGYR